MKFGWIKDNGKDYFMGVTGTMLKDTVTPDGFKVGSDGAWLGPESVVDQRGFTTPYDDHSYFLDENSLALIFDAETAEFLAGYNYRLSDREKAERVYEYIQERAVYDTGEFKPDSDTIYGGLILGKSECVGFARTYKLLGNAVGQRCGISNNVAHAWNSVMIDGECGKELTLPQ